MTLACGGGILEVADFLIKAGADLELGASTLLMESSQEGYLELVRDLLEAGGHHLHRGHRPYLQLRERVHRRGRPPPAVRV